MPAPVGSTDLFSALKAVRKQIAQEENVPAYLVFTNAALTDMAAKRPHTMLLHHFCFFEKNTK